MRKQLLRTAKIEMKRWIEQMDETNYIDTKEKIEKYYSVMEAVSQLPEPPPPAKRKKAKPQSQSDVVTPTDEEGLSKEKEEERHPLTAHATPETSAGDIPVKKERKKYGEHETEAYKTSIQSYYAESEPKIEVDSKQQLEEEKSTGYVFERKLRGGVLPAIDAFVPEGIIRKLGLEHGDLVQAEKMFESGGRTKYAYTLVASQSAGDAPGRCQLDYAMIEKEAGSLVVKKNCLTGEAIRFNDVRYSMLLNEQDIQYYNLKEGDIIDVAYRESDPSENKILWKHESQLPVSPTVEKTEPKQKSNENESKQEAPIEQTLAGTTVLVVGNEGSRVEYQAEIEKRGGTFLTALSGKRPDTYSSLVRKCDFAIFLLGLNGHTSMKQFKQLCKEYRKPFEATFNQGITSVVRTAEELAEKGIELHQESM